MKKLLVMLLAFVAITVSAQKIEKDEIDDFTDQRYLETSWVRFNSGITSGKYMTWRFIYHNNQVKLQIGVFNNFCVRENDESIILFDDNSKIKIKAIYTQCASIGGNYGSEFGGYSGSKDFGLVMTFSSNEFDKLYSSLAKKIRVYYSDGYLDYEIKKSDKIRRAYCVLMQTLHGGEVLNHDSIEHQIKQREIKIKEEKAVNPKHDQDYIEDYRGDDMGY